MIHLSLITLLAFLFRYFRELEDEIARGNHSNYSLIPNSENASTAKWKYPLKPYQPKWYHFGFKCNHAERFPFSSTWLVGITDAEHFYQAIQTVAIIVIVMLSTVVGVWWQTIIALILGLIIASFVKEKIKGVN